MDEAHRQKFQVRNLGTRSVTLFPSRAQISREIKAELKPGTNEITIIGLSPTVDEDSIKVEGTGSAIITDIAVESRVNRDDFQDIYPDSDFENESDSDGDNDDDDFENQESAAARIAEVKAKTEEIAKLRKEKDHAKETIASAESRLKILDSYGAMLTSFAPNADSLPKNLDISSSLETYRKERDQLYQYTVSGSSKGREIDEKIDKSTKELNKLQNLLRKERAKFDKQRRKINQAKYKKLQEKVRKRNNVFREKARVRREREMFWPKNVYQVKVSLETTNNMPLRSRQNSVSSDLVTLASETPDKADEDEAVMLCDLTLTYVTSYAYWSPSYDLILSTTTNSGALCFDAQLTNKTSETWSNCKVILSTSQADFSWLNEKIPTLVPWHVRLAAKGGFGTFGSAETPNKANEIMYSAEEMNRKTGWKAQQNSKPKPREQLFGLDNTTGFGQTLQQWKPQQMQQMQPMSAQQYQMRQQQVNASVPGGSLFGRPAPQAVMQTQAPGGAPVPVAPAPHASGAGLFGSRPSGGTTASAGGLFGSAPVNATAAFGSSNPSDSNNNETGQAYALFPQGPIPEELEEDSEAGPPTPEEQPKLDFQESAFEETGLTSTYELSGLKTLAPSPTTSKQRVARVSFKNVSFSHTVVAKYKPVAYLKARLLNGSKLSLIQGPAGLTLDGSFMGRTSLPRCSPGDSFSISLGVDPAIRVAYPKPDVKRRQAGMFSTEDSSAYGRLIKIFNTRSGDKGSKPVHITVLDQVPVSEDDKVRVDIVQPRGLVEGGPKVSAGSSAKEGKEDEDWGTATADKKAGGEVVWDVKLNAGQGVKLSLEYTCSFPTGEHVVNV
ncbi:hypothetical protein KJ359_003612 [Pestalotiopsis sp. 9143b]|nr:hypothetical protein KJ359_003612 [Pestalotiopsis sp. 9143b]